MNQQESEWIGECFYRLEKRLEGILDRMDKMVESLEKIANPVFFVSADEDLPDNIAHCRPGTVFKMRDLWNAQVLPGGTTIIKDQSQ